MAQVDSCLTKVNSFDLIVRVNEPGCKPGVSQPTPLKQNLVPRFDNKIRANQSNKMGVTKGGGHILSHFSTLRIQIRQKIHGALLIASVAHEEVGDECVHEKLKADIFFL
jgi:hypothetical protein